jgi:cytochrome c
MKVNSQKLRSTLGGFTLARVLTSAFGAYALAMVLLLPSSSAVAIQDPNAPSPDHGREIFDRRCTGCHALDNDKEGPRLRGVYGRKAGSVPSFQYSDALKKADVTWDDSNLDKWLTDPDKFIPDVDMDFHLEKPDERSAVIAYLKQLSSK